MYIYPYSILSYELEVPVPVPCSSQILYTSVPLNLGATRCMAAEASKKVYFIRHAESRWNLALRSMDVITLVMRCTDAPITGGGYRQAHALQVGLQAMLAPGESTAAVDESDGTVLSLVELGAADGVWCSPFTRCVQTALVGLLPLFDEKPKRRLLLPPPLTLKPVLRERKKFGWDSIGSARGDFCRARACAQLAALRVEPKPSASQMKTMASMACDSSEAQRRWWSYAFESRSATRRRARQLLAAILASDSTAVVVVSHSNFLRELFAVAVDNGGGTQEAELARVLRTRKLPNCAVLGCELRVTSEATGEPRLSKLRCWLPPGTELPTVGRRRKTAKVAPV